MKEVKLGEVAFSGMLKPDHIALIAAKLAPLGFALVEDKKTRIARLVKELVATVYSGDFDFPLKFRFSVLASRQLAMDYGSISAAFSQSENISIERYIMEFRAGRVKHFLRMTNQTLNEISFRLGFSSAAHLSGQFKELTGFNPTYFRSNQQVN